jgi:ABC-type branched-subunit amino acid transport system substrate-binding protein
MIKKLTRRAAVAMVPGLFLAAKGIRMARAQTKTVKIGVLQPMSGDLSPCAQEGNPSLNICSTRSTPRAGSKA